MKKLFSLLILVALFATLTILVACNQKTPPEINYPEDEKVHVHRFNSPKTYEATCDVEGYTERQCLDCGYYYRYDIKPINPNNHVRWSEKDKKFVTALEKDNDKSYTAKNCSEKSLTVKVCKECGKEETIHGGMGPHSYLYYPGNPEKDQPDEVYNPTCTVAGKNVYYCQTPGCLHKVESGKVKKLEVEIPCAGHLWGDWIVDVDPTCSLTHVANGEKHRVCDNCSEVQTEDILPHTSTAAGVRVEPTCTTVGYTIYVCDNCGIEYKREFVKPLPHDYKFLFELEGKFYYACGCGATQVTDKKIEK